MDNIRLVSSCGISDNMANFRREVTRLEDVVASKDEQISTLQAQLREKDLEIALLRNEKRLLMDRARAMKTKPIAIANPNKSSAGLDKLGSIEEEQEECSGQEGNENKIGDLPELDATAARKVRLLNRWKDLHSKMMDLLDLGRETNLRLSSISNPIATSSGSSSESEPEVKETSSSDTVDVKVKTEVKVIKEENANANVNGNGNGASGENDTLPFCTTCEDFGHTAKDCDDEECY